MIDEANIIYPRGIKKCFPEGKDLIELIRSLIELIRRHRGLPHMVKHEKFLEVTSSRVPQISASGLWTSVRIKKKGVSRFCEGTPFQGTDCGFSVLYI